MIIATTEEPVWIVLAYPVFVTVHSVPVFSMVPGLICGVRRVHRGWDVAVVSPDHLVCRNIIRLVTVGLALEFLQLVKVFLLLSDLLG